MIELLLAAALVAAPGDTAGARADTVVVPAGMIAVPADLVAAPADTVAIHPRVARAVAVTRPADDWFAEDKLRHLTMSYALTAGGYAGMRTVGAGEDSSLAAAVAIAAVAGLAKEIYDRRTGGIFSYRDLVADALGIIAGVAIARNTR